jgi:hypothetical protein
MLNETSDIDEFVINTPSVAETKGILEEVVYKQDFLDFIKGKVGNVGYITVQRKDFKDKVLWFAQVQVGGAWYNDLYQLIIKDGEIADLIDTGASGLSEAFTYELVDMSQGEFIAATCASHIGNGDLDLISLDDLGNVKYSFDHVIDRHMGFWEETGKEFGLIMEDNYYQTVADRFVGDKLEYSCYDTDGDGNTDVVFTGIREIYLNEDAPYLWREYYVKQVYLYDPDIDDFVLSDELSEQILINEY